MENQNLKWLATVLLVCLVILLIINTFVKMPEISSKAVSDLPDIMAPKINIGNNEVSVNNPYLTVRGSAEDNVDIERVMVKVNNGKWQSALGTNFWEINLNLIKGQNVVYVQAFDSKGNASPVSSKTFNY